MGNDMSNVEKHIAEIIYNHTAGRDKETLKGNCDNATMAIMRYLKKRTERWDRKTFCGSESFPKPEKVVIS